MLPDKAYLPLLIEAVDLLNTQKQFSWPLRIFDVGQARSYALGHIPQAIHIPYAALIAGTPPAPGQLPSLNQLTALFSQCGLTPETQVVAYDDERGGSACRLLWTLETLGHPHISLLNGGRYAWQQAGLPLSQAPARVEPQLIAFQWQSEVLADLDTIKNQLYNPQWRFVDARTQAEYEGQRILARRGGHIPGAIHWDWLDMMNPDNRMKPVAELQYLARQRGLDPQQTIVTYCQTHHRSSYSYIALKIAGYTQIKGYPGSWSEWGNDATTPVAL